MTGPEHYAEAERLIDMVMESDNRGVKAWGGLNLQLAQVHATLALAAVTADAAGDLHGAAHKWEAAIS